jgi:hypothetical protein
MRCAFSLLVILVPRAAGSDACWYYYSTGDWWSFDDDRATNKGKDVFKSVAEAQQEEAPKEEEDDDESKPAKKEEVQYVDDDDFEEHRRPKRSAKAMGKATSAAGAKRTGSRSRRAKTDDEPEVVNIDDDDDADDKSSKRRAAAAAAAAAEANRSAATGIMTSTTAYMLGYTKKGRKFDEPKLPVHVQQQVEKQNTEFMAEIENFAVENKSREAQHDQFKQQYESLWENAHADRSLDAACNWVSTEWLQKWVSGDVVAGEVTSSATANSDFLCEHNRIDPIKYDKMKRIAPDVWEFLKKTHGVGPDLTQTQYCKDCVAKLCLGTPHLGKLILQSDHANETCFLSSFADMEKALAMESEKTDALDSIKPSGKEATFWISKQFLREFKKKSPKQLDPFVNSDIVCAHGGLSTEPKLRQQVSASLWNYIKEYFRAAKEFQCSTASSKAKEALDVSGEVHENQNDDDDAEDDDDLDACVICRKDARAQQRDQDAKKKTRTAHKKRFSHLAKMATSLDGARKSPAYCRRPDKAGNYFLLDFVWLRKWKQWLDDNTGLLAEPGPISSKSLKCSHDKLNVNVLEMLENHQNKSFAVVDQDTWTELVDAYGVVSGESSTDSIEILLPEGSEDDEPIVQEYCKECVAKAAETQAEKAANFTEQAFVLKKIDQRGSGRGAPRGAKPTRGVKFNVIGVNFFDTVVDLKLKVFAATEVSPNEQMLYVTPKAVAENENIRDDFARKIALDSPGKTLADFGIKAGDIITLVQVDPQEGGEEDEIVALTAADFSNRNRSERGVGFAGTALFGGYVPKPQKVATASDEIEIEVDASKKEDSMPEAPARVDSDGWEQYDLAAFEDVLPKEKPAQSSSSAEKKSEIQTDHMDVDSDGTVDLEMAAPSSPPKRQASPSRHAAESKVDQVAEEAVHQSIDLSGEEELPVDGKRKKRTRPPPAQEDTNLNSSRSEDSKSRRRKLNDGNPE